MRKPRRHIKHLPVFTVQLKTGMLAESGRIRADIHHHIQYSPGQHPHQLPLRIRLPLEMQTPYYSLPGKRLVILDKLLRDPVFFEQVDIIGFVKISSVVLIESRGDLDNPV